MGTQMTKCSPPISTDTLGLPKGSSKVTRYESDWPLRFSEEKARILSVFADADVQVHHIGSTSVPGLRSKPVIDMAMEFGGELPMEAISRAFRRLGYRCHRPRKTNEGYWYEYGEDLTFFQVYVFASGSLELMRLLRFTQVLTDNRQAKLDYQDLKDHLSEKYGDDPRAYVREKREFIDRLMDRYAGT